LSGSTQWRVPRSFFRDSCGPRHRERTVSRLAAAILCAILVEVPALPKEQAMTELTRRLILASGAVAALIPAGARAGGSGSGGSSRAGGQVPSIYRYRVGDFVLTAACDGMGKRPLEGFISNADKAD